MYINYDTLPRDLTSNVQSWNCRALKDKVSKFHSKFSYILDEVNPKEPGHLAPEIEPDERTASMISMPVRFRRNEVERGNKVSAENIPCGLQ